MNLVGFKPVFRPRRHLPKSVLSFQAQGQVSSKLPRAKKAPSGATCQVHGPDSLRPERKNPDSTSERRFTLLTKSSNVCGLKDWAAAYLVAWDAALALSRFKGLRKAEVTLAASEHGRKVLQGISFGNLTWRICGRLVSAPTPQQILSLRCGDAVGVKPVLCKNDQVGTNFADVIWFPYSEERDNAARCLARVELHFGIKAHERNATFLFLACKESKTNKKSP